MLSFLIICLLVKILMFKQLKTQCLIRLLQFFHLKQTNKQLDKAKTLSFSIL